MTDGAALFEDIARSAVGRRVSATRIFLFTLQIYFESDDAAEDVLELWCEPSWHLRNANGVVAGSGAIEAPSNYDDDEEIQRASDTVRLVGAATRILVGQDLLSMNVDDHSRELVAR